EGECEHAVFTEVAVDEIGQRRIGALLEVVRDHWKQRFRGTVGTAYDDDDPRILRQAGEIQGVRRFKVLRARDQRIVVDRRNGEVGRRRLHVGWDNSVVIHIDQTGPGLFVHDGEFLGARVDVNLHGVELRPNRALHIDRDGRAPVGGTDGSG